MRIIFVLLPLVVVSLPYLVERQKVYPLEISPSHLTVDNGIGYLGKREALKRMENLKVDFSVLEFKEKVMNVLKRYKNAALQYNLDHSRYSAYSTDEYEKDDNCDDTLPSRIILHNGDECTSDPKKFVELIRNSDPEPLDACEYTIIEAKDLIMSEEELLVLKKRFGLAEDVDYNLFDGNGINNWQL